MTADRQDISVPHWSNGKDAARRGEAKGGGGEEAGGRREAAYQDVRAKSYSLSESTVHTNLHRHNPYNVLDHSADVAAA